MATNLAFEAQEPEEPSAGILHRLRLLRNRAHQFGEGDGHSEPPPGKTDLRTRRRLLNNIRDFLLEHDLEVVPSTLLAAHEACAGSNPVLTRSIARRRESGESVTQEWLEEKTEGNATSDSRSIEDLARKLERGIDDLSHATSSVRKATSDYGDELERRVDDLQAAPDTEAVIAQIADFAKAMLERSRQTEEELRASEAETAALRRNLDRARRDAEVDYLTGLPNRRAFEEVLQAYHAEALERDEPLSVAFCDIDRFKAINDTHGHEAGDRIIREVAESLSGLCRENCFIARHGGEEFVLLYRGMSPEDAFARLDGAREELAQRRMINRRTEKPFGIVTFSGGIADVSQFADPRDALVAADEALYRAKEGGRNQILLAGS